MFKVNLNIPISTLSFRKFYQNDNFPIWSSYFTLVQVSIINPFYNQDIGESEGDAKTLLGTEFDFKTLNVHQNGQ